MIVNYRNYCLAKATWTEFSLKRHSRYMATLSAMACLAQTLEERQPNRVIELGGGIGTITALVKRHIDAPPLLATLEDNPVCLEQLSTLFEDGNAGHVIVKTPAELVGMTADLLIVDGGYCSPHELSTIRQGTTVFLEGNRGPERTKIGEYVTGRGWRIAFAEDFLEQLEGPVQGKGCWIGTVL